MTRRRRSRALLLNVLLVVVLAAGGIAAYAAFHHSSASASSLRTVPVTTGNVTSTVSAAGTLNAATSLTLNFTTNGPVTAIYVKPGDKVTKGQALASTDPTSADQKVQSAQLDIVKSQQTLNKDGQTLATDKTSYGTSSTQYQQAAWQYTSDQAALTQAQIALEQAQTARQQADLFAPMDGTITSVNGVVGESSSVATTGFMTMGSLDKLQAKAPFAEVDAAKVKVGMSAVVTFDALPNERIPATVTSVATVPTTTNNVNSYPVTVDLSAPPNGVLMGMSANVAVTVDSRQGVLEVSPSAITSVGNRSTVTKLTNGKQEVVVVQTGLKGDSATEIVSGVNAGDQLVVRAATGSSGTANNTTGRFGGVTGGGGIGGAITGGGGRAGG